MNKAAQEDGSWNMDGPLAKTFSSCQVLNPVHPPHLDFIPFLTLYCTYSSSGIVQYIVRIYIEVVFCFFVFK